MKIKFRLSLFAAFIFLFSSCQKVVDISLKNADKKYVIEGMVTNTRINKVLLSQTRDFNDSNSFKGISGAQITVTDNVGNAAGLTETSPGIYETNSINGTPGRTYNLNVVINGLTFTSSSTMPLPVNLDTVYITQINIFGKDRKMVTPEYKDPAGLGNSYQFLLNTNGVKDNQVYVQNDALTDGRIVSRPLHGDDSTELKTGDKITLEFRCIDPAVYTYWYSLSESATGETRNATPANPVSNIQGGALGYFSVHTVQTKSLIVP